MVGERQVERPILRRVAEIRGLLRAPIASLIHEADSTLVYCRARSVSPTIRGSLGVPTISPE
ncbi:hypothetical protein ACMWP8_28545, partial [Escherichia coli]|uniref:hypothetical protein n=1 Tax=Escherichia coli TaxID=562 RepID=UPI0039DF305B